MTWLNALLEISLLQITSQKRRNTGEKRCGHKARSHVCKAFCMFFMFWCSDETIILIMHVQCYQVQNYIERTFVIIFMLAIHSRTGWIFGSLNSSCWPALPRGGEQGGGVLRRGGDSLWQIICTMPDQVVVTEACTDQTQVSFTVMSLWVQHA